MKLFILLLCMHHMAAKACNSSYVSNLRPLNLIFTFNARPADNGGSIFETDWIEQSVFGSHLDRPVRVHHNHLLGDNQILMSDSIYVFLFDPKPRDLFRKLKMGGFTNYGGFHMGDENGKDDKGYYKDLSMLFHNYWNSNYQMPEYGMYVPLGPKTGLCLSSPQVFIPASHRQYLCNFVGSLRMNRAYALQALTYKRNECYIHTNDKWASANSMHAVHYRSILLDSKFTLCPFGNNEESLRFYEALEAGSIPIVETSKTEMGDFISNGLDGEAGAPFPRLKDWTEINSVLERLNSNAKDMDKMQMDTISWWLKAKTRFQHRVKQIVDQSFDE